MAPQTTQFSYDFYKPDKPTDLIYQVDAHYPSETPVLRLSKTNDLDVPQQWSTGRVLYSKTVPFGHAADFTTTIQFIIRPNNTAPQADGLAFFIVPAGHNFPSQIGGNLGLFEPSASKTSHVFAIAFDTYSDNPNYVNLGIDIESRKPSAKAQVPISFVGKELTLKVSYVASTKAISASVTDGSQTFPVTFTYDLSQILPSSVQVGLASSTGVYVAVHDVNTWDFTSTIP
ncbi:bark agglutinin I polypeptide B-like [Salvia splendens]|uniref:bark agglutinin I polypeptide B-like n=1 Tax=Salvia splendens TaxID=180675 RepID=UPI001C2608A4|nr:bark agglutinin I polypeptide B-like [Salvia splendens]XP_042006017.1 bark agglutinin I polypeptide B-like [Salvia splendens]XP_042006018.1 bark agglutinin I polypeptide B-like [Salvia splendens]XP_042006019.1 bark agglutinin I polypeptide B-like [Salvia splendens]